MVVPGSMMFRMAMASISCRCFSATRSTSGVLTTIFAWGISVAVGAGVMVVSGVAWTN